MYEGALVCGYTRVCDRVDIRAQRYSAQISAYACALARDGGTGGRTGLGPRQPFCRTAAKSTSGNHIFKCMVIYVCILVVVVDPTARQFQVHANALARGGEILFRDFP